MEKMSEEGQGDVTQSVIQIDNHPPPSYSTVSTSGGDGPITSQPVPPSAPLLRADLNILDNFNQLFVIPRLITASRTQGMLKLVDNTNSHVLTFEVNQGFRRTTLGYYNLLDASGNVVMGSTSGCLMKVSTADQLRSLGQIQILSKRINIEPAVGTESYYIKSEENVFFFPYGVKQFQIVSTITNDTVGIIKKRTSEADMRFSIEFNRNLPSEEKGLILMAALNLYEKYINETECCGFRYPVGAEEDPRITMGITFCFMFSFVMFILIVAGLIKLFV